jgi:uncharacterized Fe-S cluster-containing protein
MMAIDLKGFSLSQLLAKLHGAILELIDAMGSAIKQNNKINSEEIEQLREHIVDRLRKNEEIEDNMKLIQILDLFKKDSAVMELVNEDAEDWLDFINTIEERLKRGPDDELEEDELRDIEQIKRLTGEIKAIIRK